jgi:hypothetical protein
VKYKHIPSAARNFAESFVSDNNFVPGDSIVSLLARRVVTTHDQVLEIDLQTGEAIPESLSASPVRESIDAYVTRFPQLLRSQGVSPEAVRTARMRLSFVLDRLSRSPGFPNSSEMPLDCTVVILDDRAREHSIVFRRWVLFFNAEPHRRPAHHQSYEGMR